MKAFVILAVFMAIALVADGACPSENGVPLQDFSLDGCNSCRCSDNKAVCTLMLCLGGSCIQDYWPDPCNFCKCNDGNAECTYASCPTSWDDWYSIERWKSVKFSWNRHITETNAVILTVLSLISAPGACKIEMKNLNFPLFLISVLFFYNVKYLFKYEPMSKKQWNILLKFKKGKKNSKNMQKKSLKNTVF